LLHNRAGQRVGGHAEGGGDGAQRVLVTGTARLAAGLDVFETREPTAERGVLGDRGAHCVERVVDRDRGRLHAHRVAAGGLDVVVDGRHAALLLLRRWYSRARALSASTNAGSAARRARYLRAAYASRARK